MAYKTYKLHFLFPVTAKKFDPDGMRKWVKWVRSKLDDNCLDVCVEVADIYNTQPIFPNTYNAIVSFEFADQFLLFDTFAPNLLEILDGMAEFTDTAPIMQGCFIEDREPYNQKSGD